MRVVPWPRSGRNLVPTQTWERVKSPSSHSRAARSILGPFPTAGDRRLQGCFTQSESLGIGQPDVAAAGGAGVEDQLGTAGEAAARVSTERRNSVRSGRAACGACWARKAAFRPRRGCSDGATRSRRRRGGPEPRPSRATLLGGVAFGLVAEARGVGDGRGDVAIGRHHLARRVGIDDPDPVDGHVQARGVQAGFQIFPDEVFEPAAVGDEQVFQRRPADILAEDALRRGFDGGSTAVTPKSRSATAGVERRYSTTAASSTRFSSPVRNSAALVAPGAVSGVPGDRARCARRRRSGQADPRHPDALRLHDRHRSTGAGQRTCRPGSSSGGRYRPQRWSTPTWSGPIRVIPEAR